MQGADEREKRENADRIKSIISERRMNSVDLMYGNGIIADNTLHVEFSETINFML